ncbi:MAG: heterodisulfide reductase-related iron-sulfur binding cluster [Actinomycetota bacterium]|nr:heterodisulfide reductase-related iron-sulfur binding cluster [Actinomycetota bacterium]
MNDYIFFWGCTIPNRFPFIEKSLRFVLDELGVQYKEIEGFTCCPEKFIIETISRETWYLTAARNLALAEAHGADLLVACNGCYSTFRSVISELESSSELRDWVARELRKVGLEFNFRSSVKHVIEVLHDQVGCQVIERRVTSPLIGMNVAVHYGCQILNPSPVVRVDDPLRPEKLDRIVEALGANVVDYNTKLLCCGESLGRSGFIDKSLAAARLKLFELHNLEVDALVVMCPACFLQFDTQQSLIKKQKEELHIPVFYFSELIGLALGMDPSQMGFDMHRVNVQSFFDMWKENEKLRLSIPEVFDYDLIRACVACESCANDCPVAQVDENFHPHEILRMILDGSVEDVISGEEIWNCLECGTCVELCPNNFGMTKVFKEAKRLALDRGLGPPEVFRSFDLFQKTGILAKSRDAARKRLGLDPVSRTGYDELSRMLGKKRKE